ncbi:MAG: ferredoxin [Methanomicrobiales archaeon]
MKVTIDRYGCVSCGTCWDTCPDFFDEDPDDSLSQVTEKFRIVKNPGLGSSTKDQDFCAKGAAESCPAEVIPIEEYMIKTHV